MFVDSENKTVTCKIAYYGPGLSGKSTNFQYLHDHAPIQAGQIISTDIDAERTLHFQFVRNDVQELNGHRVIFDFHTIPGQSYYLATRLELLEGADGIVFVVDSTREAMDENIDSMNDLYENLRKKAIANDIPLCVQFNKQDSPSALPIDQLTPLLNSSMKQSFAASATNGSGVIETMQYITDEVMHYIQERGLSSSGAYEAQSFGKPATAEPNTLTPNNPVSLNTSPVTSAVTKNEYWLLTCYACDSILEVPKAKPGDLFACGNCRQTLQVVDPETGVTRAPQQQAPPAVPQPPAQTPGQAPGAGVEESSYSMQALPRSAPAGPAPLPPAAPPPSENSEYGMEALPDPSAGAAALASASADPSGAQNIDLPAILPGYDTLSKLDHSLLGQRFMLRDQNTQAKVKAFVIAQEATRQPNFRQQLEAQVHSATQVHHQHAAALLGLHWNGDTPIILTQHTEDCESLHEVLARRKKLSPPQAIDIAHKVALALAEVHRRGICHGWLRPESIEIGPNGTVVLDDIGVPKLSAYLVREGRGRTAATEYYLAPEQHSGEIQSDGKTDVFLLGLLLFRMLTGEGMITGFSAHEALHKLKSAGPKQLRSANPELSRELDNLCNQMCALERKDRFQDMNQLAGLLAKFGGGAKRHTLRATKTHTRSTVNPGSQHTGSHTRNHTRSHTRSHTRTGDSYQDYDGHKPRKQKTSNLFPILVLLFMLAAGFFAWNKFEEERRRQGLINPADNDQTVEPGDFKNQDRNNGDQADKQPEVRKSLASRIEAKLKEFEDQPGNTELDKEIISMIGQMDQGRRRVQFFDDLKRIREKHTDMLAKNNADDQPDQDDEPNQKDPQDQQDDPPEQEPPNTAKLLQDIDYHLQRSHFGKALASAKAIPNQAVRETQLKMVAKKHKNAKTSLQLQIYSLNDLDKIKTMLSDPRTEWGMDGDTDWADNLYQAARQRIAVKQQREEEEQQSQAAEDEARDAQETAESGDELSEPVTLNGFNYKALLIDLLLDQALLNRNTEKAHEFAESVPGSSKEGQAMSLKLQLDAQAIKVMGTALRDNNVRFRVTAPFNRREKWDVKGIKDTGLQLQSPQGSSASASWDQLETGEWAGLCEAIAQHAMATGQQQAIACVMLLRAGAIGPATVAQKAAAKNAYSAADELDLLIEMRRMQPIAALVSTALDAHKKKNRETLNNTYQELKQQRGLQQDSEAFVEQLASLVTTPESEEAHPATLKNALTFTDPDDVEAFTQRTGKWQVVSEKLVNLTSQATLKRDDMGGTSKLSYKITFPEQSGTVNINFRGASLRIKVAEQKFHLVHGEKATPLVDYPFVAQLPYSVNMWLDDQRQMHVEINQAASQQIALGTLSDTMDIAVLDITGVSVDEIIYDRAQAVKLPAIDKAKQDMIRTVLGWEPYGGAELHAPAIKLPPWPVNRSGIFRAITPQDKGVSFKMSGHGDLYILIGDKTINNLDGQKIPLPMNEEEIVSVTVTWKKSSMRIETLRPMQASPDVIEITKMQVPLKHICIESSKMLNILEPPVMKR